MVLRLRRLVSRDVSAEDERKAALVVRKTAVYPRIFPQNHFMRLQLRQFNSR